MRALLEMFDAAIFAFATCAVVRALVWATGTSLDWFTVFFAIFGIYWADALLERWHNRRGNRQIVDAVSRTRL